MVEQVPRAPREPRAQPAGAVPIAVRGLSGSLGLFGRRLIEACCEPFEAGAQIFRQLGGSRAGRVLGRQAGGEELCEKTIRLTPLNSGAVTRRARRSATAGLASSPQARLPRNAARLLS